MYFLKKSISRYLQEHDAGGQKQNGEKPRENKVLSVLVLPSVTFI